MSDTYKSAGVDKEAGYAEVQLIKKFIGKTKTSGVLSDIGGFGGLFALDTKEFTEPVLVSGTDGVGTKLKLAIMSGKVDTVGEDCVAMCVNDILCHGAKPLFFLDYIATGKLEPERMAKIVEGVANGCVKAGAALIGGETAEMPGFYEGRDFDIAGFAVGVVNKPDIIDGSAVKEGDIILGLPSSGVHSNGFSLVRKLVFEKMGYEYDHYIEDLGMSIGDALLVPTRIYTNPVYDLIRSVNIHGMCHITGGGFYENVPRMMPKGLRAKISTASFPVPAIFRCLQKFGNIEEKEMFSTFNMGIGFMLAVAPKESETAKRLLNEKGETFYEIGVVEKGEDGIVLC